MSFAEPLFLWLLALPAVWLVLELVRAATPESLRWPRIRRLWAGPGGISSATRASLTAPRWRLALGLALTVLAVARPQWGRIEEKTFESSREVLLALDLSRSMLAEDVKPNRLTRARLLIESLLDKLKGERVGLLLFSGTSFLQSPLSADYEVLREFLPALNPEYLPEGGSDYDRMLKTALESFSNEAGADRYLIVLSDGESTTDDWRRHLEELTKRHIRVVALGVGTAAGSVMPAKEGGFVKDERGAVVMTRLEPATLQQLASGTGGAYADASSWIDLPAILAQTVERGQVGKTTERTTFRLGEQFQWFLAPALLLLAWSYWIEFPVRPRGREVRRASAARTAASVAAALAVLLGLAGTPRAGAAHLATPPVISAPPPMAAAPQEDAVLPKIVERLAAKSALNAPDCAHLARETLSFGEAELAAQRPPRPGVVHDGLAAVDLGEKLNPKEADWADLRAKLLKLLEPPPEQKSPEQQKQDEQKKQDQQKQQQQDQKQKDQPQNQDQSQDKKQDSQPKESSDSSQKQDRNSEPQEKSGDPQSSGQPDEQDGKQDPKPSQTPQQKAFDAPKDEKPAPATPQENPGAPPAEPQPTQTVGGEKADASELEKHPQLAIPLHQLEEARSKDSPAQLFKLLQRDEPPPPQKPKKDW